MSEEVPDARTRLGIGKVERAPTTTATPIHVRCAGIWDGGPPCGWEGGMFLDEEGCPMCGGEVELADPKVEQTPNLKERAIQLAAIALHGKLHGKLFGTPEQLRRYAAVAVTAAWDILEVDLQATRDRLADLQGEHDLTKAQFNDFAEEAFERDRQRAVQLGDMDRVVSLANAERNEARDRLATAQAEIERLRRVTDLVRGMSLISGGELQAALDALDRGVAQGEDG